MKPILFSIVFSVFSLSNTSINIVQFDELKNCDNISIQHEVYTNQSLILKNEDIKFITCTGCHGGNADQFDESEFKKNYDAQLIVHQENNSQFIEGLEAFVDTHDEDQAAAKKVNYNKVVELIANY